MLQRLRFLNDPNGKVVAPDEHSYTGRYETPLNRAADIMINLMQNRQLPNITQENRSFIENNRQLFITKHKFVNVLCTFLSLCSDAGTMEGKELASRDTHPLEKLGSIPQQGAASVETFANQELSKEELLGLINVRDDTGLLSLSDEEFNKRMREIPPRDNLLRLKCKIRDIRIDLQEDIREAQEKEEAERAEQKWQEDADHFYSNARITKIVKDEHGQILWCEVDYEGEVP